MTRREQRNLIIAILTFLFVNFSIPFSIGYKWSHAGDASATWPVAQGRIVSTNGAPNLKFAYDVDGRACEHSRIRFGFLGDARAAVQDLTNGASVKVSYHPADPTQAVLVPGSSAGTHAMKFIGMLGMMATCAAAFLVWRNFRV